MKQQRERFVCSFRFFVMIAVISGICLSGLELRANTGQEFIQLANEMMREFSNAVKAADFSTLYHHER